MVDLDLTQDAENALLILLYFFHPRYRYDDLLGVVAAVVFNHRDGICPDFINNYTEIHSKYNTCIHIL